MIHYHISTSIFLSKGTGNWGLHTDKSIRLVFNDDDGESFDYETDQDWIVTSQPESNPYTKEHDCFHEKLRGTINVSPGIPEDGTAFMTIMEPSVGSTISLSYGDPSTHRPYGTEVFHFTSVTRAKQSDGTLYYNVWGYSDLDWYEWNSYWREWRHYTSRSANTLRCEGRCDVTAVPLPSDSEMRRAFIEQALSKAGLLNWQTSRKHFLSLVYQKADELVHPGALAAEAAASARRLDINTLAYIKDIVEIPAFGAGLVNLASDFSDELGKMGKYLLSRDAPYNLKKKIGKKLAKDMSSGYLSSHYGLKLTILDTQEIASAIDKVDTVQKYQTLGASDTCVVELPGWGTSCEVSVKLTAIVGSYDDKQLYCCESIKESMDQLSNHVKRAGYELDVLPTASNIWDLVPFSFVADWFLPIGDYFAQCETRNYMATLPVKRCFITRKTIYDETGNRQFPVISPTGEASLTASFTIHHEIYDRVYSDVLPIPPQGKNNTGNGGAYQHVVEATALLVSSAH
jgi:hypothetical protein